MPHTFLSPASHFSYFPCIKVATVLMDEIIIVQYHVREKTVRERRIERHERVRECICVFEREEEIENAVCVRERESVCVSERKERDRDSGNCDSVLLECEGGRKLLVPVTVHERFSVFRTRYPCSSLLSFVKILYTVYGVVMNCCSSVHTHPSFRAILFETFLTTTTFISFLLRISIVAT